MLLNLHAGHLRRLGFRHLYLAFFHLSPNFFTERCPKVRFISQTGLGIKAPGPHWLPAIWPTCIAVAHPLRRRSAVRRLQGLCRFMLPQLKAAGQSLERRMELDELDVLSSCQGKGKEKRKKKTALAALARLKAVANVGDST